MITELKLTEKEAKVVEFALDYLHDADLTEFGDENIAALESVMDKLGIDYIKWDILLNERYLA